MTYFRVNCMVNGRWQNDVLATYENLLDILRNITYRKGLNLIRVDECDENGDILQ